VVERVYSALRTDGLYKADYFSSLKGSLIPENDLFLQHVGQMTLASNLQFYTIYMHILV